MVIAVENQNEKTKSFPCVEVKVSNRSKLVYDWIENHWPAKRFVKRIPPKAGDIPSPPSSESDGDFLLELTKQLTFISSSSSLIFNPSSNFDESETEDVENEYFLHELEEEIKDMEYVYPPVAQREETPVVYYEHSPTFREHRSYASSPSTMTYEELYPVAPLQTSTAPLLPQHIAFVPHSACTSPSTLSSEEIYPVPPTASIVTSPAMEPSQCQCCVAGCPLPATPVMDPAMMYNTLPYAVFMTAVHPQPTTFNDANNLPAHSQEIYSAPPMPIFTLVPSPVFPVISPPPVHLNDAANSPMPIFTLVPTPTSPVMSPPLVYTPPIRLHSNYLPSPGFVELLPVPFDEPHQFIVNFFRPLPVHPHYPSQTIIQNIHPVPLEAVPMPQLFF